MLPPLFPLCLSVPECDADEGEREREEDGGAALGQRVPGGELAQHGLGGEGPREVGADADALRGDEHAHAPDAAQQHVAGDEGRDWGKGGRGEGIRPLMSNSCVHMYTLVWRWLDVFSLSVYIMCRDDIALTLSELHEP